MNRKATNLTHISHSCYIYLINHKRTIWRALKDVDNMLIMCVNEGYNTNKIYSSKHFVGNTVIFVVT